MGHPNRRSVPSLSQRNVQDCAAAAGFAELQPILMLKPTREGAPTTDITRNEYIFVFQKPQAAARRGAAAPPPPATAAGSAHATGPARAAGSAQAAGSAHAADSARVRDADASSALTAQLLADSW